MKSTWNQVIRESLTPKNTEYKNTLLADDLCSLTLAMLDMIELQSFITNTKTTINTNIITTSTTFSNKVKIDVKIV